MKIVCMGMNSNDDRYSFLEFREKSVKLCHIVRWFCGFLIDMVSARQSCQRSRTLNKNQIHSKNIFRMDQNSGSL